MREFGELLEIPARYRYVKLVEYFNDKESCDFKVAKKY